MAQFRSLYDEDYDGPGGGNPELPGDLPGQPAPGPTVPGPTMPNQPPVPSPWDDQQGGPGGGGGGAGVEGGYPGQNGPSFNFGPAPGFVPPEFVRPTMADVQGSPGYQFRVQQGTDALERSAAARGVLRTGGTLTDLVEYGQNYASGEYQRNFDQTMSAFDRRYAGARDAYAPRLADWQNRANAERARGLAAYQREWDAYTFARRNQGGGGGTQPWDGEAPPSDIGLDPEAGYGGGEAYY